MGQTWNGNVLHDAGNVASDVVGFFAPPPGDPGRLRQVAGIIEDIATSYEQDVRATNAAIDELTSAWGGDAAQAFTATWYGHSSSDAPSAVLERAHHQLQQFAQDIKDYAAKLEHAQHDYWLQMAITGALTAVNALQLGMDPATDAAEAGTVVAMKVSASFAMKQLSTFGIRQAFIGFTGDLVGQLGADVWDRVDRNFGRAGDCSVPVLDANELLASGLPLPAASVLGPLERTVGRETLAARVRAQATRALAVLVPDSGNATRSLNFRPRASDLKWGLTTAHLDKHVFGANIRSLRVIDPAGHSDRWFGCIQDLAGRPATSTLQGGIQDIVGVFQKADGSGVFRLGIRIAPGPDGTWDLVTLLTKQ